MDIIERYQLKEVVGRGGMSTVYRAYDTGQAQEVAVKLIHESLSENESAQARFSQEVQFVMALQHPAIVPVLDYGEMDGRLFIVMPYLSGGSLRERLNDGPLPFDQCLSILEPIVAALEAAHARQIIHRDIKPHNILLDEAGQAYLSDFGVARLVDPKRSGETITLVGTPEYIAPEQILGRPISPQTDIYQLGVTVFHMLAGERPFTGSSIPQQHLKHSVPSVELLNPDLPDGCDRVIWRAMAKDMAARYSTPTAFLESLAGLSETLAVTAFTPWSLALANPEGPVEQSPVKGSGSYRRYIMSAMGLFFILVSAVFFSINNIPTLEAAANPVVETIREFLPGDSVGLAVQPVEQVEDGPQTPALNNNQPPGPPNNNGRHGNNGPGRNGGGDGHSSP